jgi:hypothetical protein
MDEQRTRSRRWLRFVVTVLLCVMLEQVVGWVLWRDPLTTRLVPAMSGALAMSWYFTFGARSQR